MHDATAWHAHVELDGVPTASEDILGQARWPAGYHAYEPTGDRRRTVISLILEDGARPDFDHAVRTAQAVGDIIGVTGPVSRVTFTTDERLAEDSGVEFIGATEAAHIIGVSRQRVGQLVATDPGFPAGMDLATGTVWTRTAIETYAATRTKRTGGRRRKTTP